MEVVQDQVYGVVHAALHSPLTSTEEYALSDWIERQNADGFGEGFEQRPIQTNDGELYVHLWDNSDDYFVRIIPQRFFSDTQQQIG